MIAVRSSALPNPWYLIGWLVLAGIVVLAAFTVIAAPRYDPEFALAGIIVAAWAILSLGAVHLYRRIGRNHSRGTTP
jgi:hypothetical protein